jgi:DNA (cytosine-5)-methyltransferase 1
MTTERSVLSLFSGAGGLDLGFKWAGLIPKLALDNDSAAEWTYRHNHLETAFHRLNLRTAKAQEIVDLWAGEGLDHPPAGLIGGPPCQPFSLGSASRRRQDPRRDLALRFALLLKGLNEAFKLDFFVFENVKGLLGRRHQNYYVLLMQLFRLAGFQTRPLVLDAADFCVAQHRQRLFIVGINHRKYPRAIIPVPRPGGQAHTPVAERLGALPLPTYFKRGLKPHSIAFHPNHWTMVPVSPKFSNGILKQNHSNGRSFRVLRWEEPSWTVSFGHREIFVHPVGDRRLSVLEAMLLQGFPFKYELAGTLSDQFRLVSDAVPPPLAYAVAGVIRSAIDSAQPTGEEPAG